MIEVMLLFCAIPVKKEPKMYADIRPNYSRFVNLTDCDSFVVEMQYPQLQMQKAVKECYVREEVFERLLVAQHMLPCGIRLKILDAWRPFDLQQEIYEKYSSKIIEKFGLSSASFEEQQNVIAKYVSPPIPNIATPPVHTTGGAVDITLLGADGLELDMGTAFDDFTLLAETAYFEKSDRNLTVRENRRLLYHCMTSAGFENLPSEWWHFDYGDRFWAYYHESPAIYEGVFCIEEVSCK